MLDRRIRLIQPGAEQRSASGQVTHGPSVRHEVWAHAVDTGGNEDLEEGIVAETTIRTYRVRDADFLSGIDARWCVEEDGQEFNIQSVQRGLRIDKMLTIRALRGR